jgi:YEATS family
MEDVPAGANAVIYQLDENYYDPTREVRRDVPHFEQVITSYGDYEIRAQIRRKAEVDLSTETLSHALKRTYGEVPTSAAVRRAIQQLQSN